MPNKRVWLFAAVAVLCFIRSAWGQVSEAESVKGALTIDSPAVMRAEVTLRELQGEHIVASESVGADGRFEFRHVPYGQYRLTVLDAANHPIHEEIVAIHDQQQPIEVAVKVSEGVKPPAGAVSAQELLHPPSRKALKAFITAQTLSRAGEYEKAAEELEKAIRLAPDYADAWVNLGAQHIRLKRYDQAIAELSHASEISHPTAIILGNMAFAQYMLRRYAEGTRSARAAIALDPSNARSQYLLGSFLAGDERTRAEGIAHLEAAARTIPAAREELDRARKESAQAVTRP